MQLIIRFLTLATTLTLTTIAAWGQTNSVIGSLPQPNTVVIGQQGEIVIDTKTGHVTITGPQDDAAREFWRVVNEMAPVKPRDPHHYTPDEIDRMRGLVAVKTLDNPGFVGMLVEHRSNWEQIFDAEIEDRLRTYLTAGVTADDLEAEKAHKPLP